MPQSKRKSQRRTDTNTPAGTSNNAPGAAQNAAQALSARDRLYLICVALMGLTLAAYIQILNHDFVEYDDDIHIFKNPFIAHGLGAVGHFWLKPYEKLYIPVSYTIIALLAQAARVPAAYAATLTNTGALFNPHIFHSASLLLHLVNVILVFLLLRRLVQNDVAAGIGAAVFALHPLQVESVAWASEIRGLLAAVFELGAIHCYMSFLDRSEESNPTRRRISYGACVLLAGLSIFSKPTAVVLPAILLLVAWYYRPPKGFLAWTVPVAIPTTIGAISVFVTYGIQNVPAILDLPLWQRILVASDALVFYLGKCVAPIDFAITYGRSPSVVLAHDWGEWSFVLLALAGGLVLLLRKRAPWLLFGLAFTAISLASTLGLAPFFFQLRSTVADRYAYTSLIGVAFLVAMLVKNTPSKQIRAFISVVALLLAWPTYLQARNWSSTIPLFSSSLRSHPAPLTRLALGEEYMRKGQYDRGIALMAGAPIDPNDPYRAVQFCDDLGDACMETHRLQNAISAYQQALAFKPTDTQALEGIGYACYKLADYAMAKQYFVESATINPRAAEPHAYLGLLYSRTGQLDQGLAEYRLALAIEPGNKQTAHNYAIALGKIGHAAPATGIYSQASASAR